MIRFAIWIASALFLLWVAFSVWSFIVHRNKRGAFQALKDAHANLSPEKKAEKTARRVEWYINLPEKERTMARWKWVESGDAEGNCRECRGDMMDTQVSPLRFLAFSEEQDTELFQVKVKVCRTCGWMSFYAATPEKLAEWIDSHKG